MPQTTITRAIECAGNERRFFKEQLGKEAEGGQWRTGDGDTQPGTVPFNHLGYLYNAVVPHPVTAVA